MNSFVLYLYTVESFIFVGMKFRSFSYKRHFLCRYKHVDFVLNHCQKYMYIIIVEIQFFVNERNPRAIYIRSH